MSSGDLGTKLKNLTSGKPLQVQTKEKRLNVVLDVELHRAARQYALDRDVTVSDVVRVLLERLLAEPAGDLDAAVRSVGEKR